MSHTMTAKETEKNVLIAHTQALNAAKLELLGYFKKAAKPEKVSMKETNVYDNF